MTRRRWIADSWDETRAALSGAQAQHLARVLRAQVGMEFDIVAGDRVRRGIVAEVSEVEVIFTLGEELEADPALPVTLLLAVFKFDRMEWSIEKATELGIERIVPVIARRTEKHLAQAAAARVERWRRIAREAAQQSRRSDVAVIEEPMPLKDAVTAAAGELRILLAEQERNVTLRDAIARPETGSAIHNDWRIRLAVGPEGGWASEEEALFAREGWRAASLGPRILRAETAAIAAVSVVSALLD
jgi:16S rRNA (uracil1498-N3)-methyltransferase